jgi:hypothetical protein
MRMRHDLIFILAVAAIRASGGAQEIQRLDPALDQLIAPNARLERIATGFNKWTEGPVWTNQATLLFAEIPANNIDEGVPGHGVHVFMHPSGYEGSAPFKGPEPGSNGMTIDADGRVTVAGHARRNVWRLESLSPNAQITVLADVYQGKKLIARMILSTSQTDLCTSPILRTDYRPKVITIRRKNCKLIETIAFLQRASKSWEHSLTEKNFSFSLRTSVGPTALRSLQMKNSCT